MVEPRKPVPRPKTKAAAKMLPKYKNLGVQKRMDEAVKLVMSGECSQAEAARNCGVTRPRLNERVKEAREKLAEQQARSAATAAERRGDAPNTTIAHSEIVQLLISGEGIQQMPVVTNEVRRVPPFAEFDEMYFSSLECFDCGVHHPTPSFHTEIMEAITDPAIKRLMINVPPGHSKSTVATVKSTIYELCRDPNSMTMIVSKSQGLAKKFLYQIQNYLTNPDMYMKTPRNLIEDWGPFTDGTSTWSKEMFYVAGRQSAEKDPTVSAWGVGQHIYGVRAHRIIMDDIADLENQRNQERVKEMLEWCMQEPGSRVGQHGKLIYVGTRVNAGDIYSHLQDLSGYKVIRYPCIVDEESQTTLWPDHYPYSAAARQRDSMGAERWQLVYQNVDTPGFGASFPPEVVEATYDATRSLGQYNPNWALVAGLDPAGANSQSGYTAMILLGLDLDTGERHLIDLVNHKQMKAPQMRDQMFDWADRYPTLRELRVESNGLQSQLVQYNQEILTRLTSKGVRVVPHITTGRNKWDADFGVESMATMFINRQITLPTKDTASRNRIKPLVEQLTSFPMGAQTDLVMALWFTELGCRDIHQRAQLPMFDPRFKAPKRIMRQRRTIDFAAGTAKVPSAFVDTAGRPMFPSPGQGREVPFTNIAGTVRI